MPITRPYNFHRAFCTALRSLKSAGLALLIVWLPAIIIFLRTGSFTRHDLQHLGNELLVAALMVLFNFAQRLREKERPPRRRRQPKQRSE